MKVCVSAVSDNLDAQLDPRFGRCQYFIIVNPETLAFEAVPNAAKDAIGGSAGVKVLTGFYGTVREAVEKYKRGELKEVGSPTVGGHFGMGRGRAGRGGWR